jgi:hypothetical protein
VKLRIRPHRRHTIRTPGPVVPCPGVHLCLKRTQRTLRLMPPPFSYPYIAHPTTLQAIGGRAEVEAAGSNPRNVPAADRRSVPRSTLTCNRPKASLPPQVATATRRRPRAAG